MARHANAHAGYEDIKKTAQSIPVIKDRANFLLQNIRHFAHSHPNDLLQSFEEVHTAALATRDQRGQYLALIGLGRCYRILAEYDNALSCLQTALGFFESLKDAEKAASILQDIGVIHRIRGEHSQALENYHRVLEICEGQKELRLLSAMIHNAVGIVHGSIGDYNNGLQSFHQSLELYRQEDDDRGVASALSNIGNMHSHLEEYQQAEQCYDKVMEIRKRENDVPGIAIVHHNLGRVYLQQGRLDRAEEAEMAALHVFQRIGDRHGEIRALGYLGQISEAKGDLDGAHSYAANSYTLAEEIGDADVLEQGLTDSGRIQLQKGEPAVAYSLLKRASAIARERGNKANESHIRKVLAECCAALGNYNEAYTQSQQSLQLYQDVLNRKKQKELAELQMRHELEDARKEKEIYRLRNEQLEMSARQKSNELAAMAMSLVRKSEMIESLKKQVRESLQTAHENFQEIVDEIFEAADRRGTSSDWALFEQRLSETLSGFVQNISARFPSLTPIELRVCSLVHMGLSTREIAGIMNIGERSVESHRYRLRKKLGLSKEADLYVFLQEESQKKEAQHMVVEEDAGFTAFLSERCPDLSTTELKVCQLIRGNLSTKEIAEFLSVSERTVETHRYNIRKKLGLPKGQNLGTQLSGMQGG